MYGAIGTAEGKQLPGVRPHQATDMTVEGTINVLNPLTGEKIPNH